MLMARPAELAVSQPKSLEPGRPEEIGSRPSGVLARLLGSAHNGSNRRRQRFKACQCGVTIGLPSLKVTLFTLNAPPGAPLRNGSIFKISSSPGFKVLAVHPSRAQCTRRIAFQIPYLGRSVRFLDFQHDKDMRRGIFPVLHDADKVDRIGLIEHGERMMCHRRAADGDKRYAYQDCRQCDFIFSAVNLCHCQTSLTGKFFASTRLAILSIMPSRAVAHFYATTYCGQRTTRPYNVGPQQ
jgi:hypothetical protein